MIISRKNMLKVMHFYITTNTDMPCHYMYPCGKEIYSFGRPLTSFGQHYCKHIFPSSFLYWCQIIYNFWSLSLKSRIYAGFLGHLSHSGDLLLWVGVRHRASCVNIFFSRTTQPILTKFGLQHLLGKEKKKYKFHDPNPMGGILG